MVCGFCKQTEHTKKTCPNLEQIHINLSQNPTKEILESLNHIQRQMILEKSFAHLSYIQRKKLTRSSKSEIMKILTDIYIHKIPIQIEAEKTEETNTPPDTHSRDEELKIIIPKINDLVTKLKKKQTIKYEKIPKSIQIYCSKNIEINNQCPICLESNTNIETNCGHSFCLECICTNMKQNHNCPYCKSFIHSVYVKEPMFHYNVQKTFI